MSGVIGGYSAGVSPGAGAAGSTLRKGPARPRVEESMAETAEIEEARAASDAAAEGAAVGDLFEYKLKERVTIHKNQSALVPILQTDIAADKVSLWSDDLGTLHPLRALWLNNASSLTLDAGSFSVLDENTFAGEGLLEAIRPGERRLLSYASDLGLVVDNKTESKQERVTHAYLHRGSLTTKSELRETRTYIVRNEDSVARTLIIEHPARPEWKLADDAPAPEEKAAGLYRFRLSVEPKETAKLVVNEAKPLYTEYQIHDVTDDQIALYVRQNWINPDMENVLRRVVAQKKVVADFDAQLQSQKQSIDQIFADQSRLRENMKALKGSTEEKALLQRYTKQLDEEESQLYTLRKKMKDTEAQRDTAKVELQKMIDQNQLDAAL